MASQYFSEGVNTTCQFAIAEAVASGVLNNKDKFAVLILNIDSQIYRFGIPLENAKQLSASLTKVVSYLETDKLPEDTITDTENSHLEKEGKPQSKTAFNTFLNIDPQLN